MTTRNPESEIDVDRRSEGAEEKKSEAVKVKIEEGGAADLSVKELKAAIEERDKQKKIAEAQKKMKEELAKKLAEAEATAEEALKKADEAEKYKNQLEEMQKLVQKERENASALRYQLKKAEARAQEAIYEANRKAEAAEDETIKARLFKKRQPKRTYPSPRLLRAAIEIYGLTNIQGSSAEQIVELILRKERTFRGCGIEKGDAHNESKNED